MTQSTDLVAHVRALAAGQHPGMVQVARGATGRRGPYPVRHALDGAGSPLLLVTADDPVDLALTAPDSHDVAAVLGIAAPDGSRIWISGWSTRLREPLARRAALEFAAHRPVADLLDVGQGHALHRMDVAEVRLEHPDGRWIEIDPEAYAEG
ncbi:hypothetical protein O7635_27235 [Asanoa sp. WMMD1127]|uniref:hypothetical protein n=1 Tax=Asanoa sp. WMMD1127 TaxID=3016107 RepID=UPI002416C659|nr:hypothetical protein [Asanoa sp. WMMD1127]MDG4825559.1 hypothetical protein [Asanoa sp. WMMD1127]